MNSRKINTWRNPYGNGYSTTRLKTIEIEEGISILVGCNGAGKTTLIKNIQEELNNENIPYVEFNGLKNTKTSLGKMIFNNNISRACAISTSSEGEVTSLGLDLFIGKLRKFIISGYSKDYGDRMFVSDVTKKLYKESKERWIFLDSVDSGFSIDNILELEEFLYVIINHCKDLNITPYIIISANSFEFANGNKCMDVMTGKYIYFEDYKDYKKFILKTRDKKNKRIAKSLMKKEEKNAKTI